jgi:hypothetical protein
MHSLFAEPGSACGCVSVIVVQATPFSQPLRSPSTVAEQTFPPRRSCDCAGPRGEQTSESSRFLLKSLWVRGAPNDHQNDPC